MIEVLKSNYLLAISPCFLLFITEALREILERRAAAHPFENVQSLLPPNLWLGLYPVPGEFWNFAYRNHLLISSCCNTLFSCISW